MHSISMYRDRDPLPRPAPSIFSRLCDLVDELGRLEHRMAHGELQCTLAALIDCFDTLIDETAGLQGTVICPLADDSTAGESPAPGRTP